MEHNHPIPLSIANVWIRLNLFLLFCVAYIEQKPLCFMVRQTADGLHCFPRISFEVSVTCRGLKDLIHNCVTWSINIYILKVKHERRLAHPLPHTFFKSHVLSGLFCKFIRSCNKLSSSCSLLPDPARRLHS